ncbi:PaaI family thioesterase [Ensifer soli]|uniref:PaaI family thioesterase n=1 Tax=Ciceribacter sp. sgz301302 TaxID=3342379 RepID=UPI0035B88B77
MSVELYPGMTASGIGTVPLSALEQDGGLAALLDLLSGKHPAPPMAKTLKMGLREAEAGRVLFSGLPSEEHLNPLGTVHGGWTATIMDSALGCAVMSVLQPGEAYTTVEFKVNLVRPLFPSSGEVFCEGRLLHRGRTLATSEATLKDGAGKLIAHGTETCAIFPVAALKR